MAENFEKYVQKGNEFLNEVALEMGIPDDKARALRALKAVLHALRNNIPAEESMQLVSQLPMMIKAVYVDNWRLGGQPKRVRKMDHFLASVKEEAGVSVKSDFYTEEDVERAVQAVFAVLKRHVTDGEIRDVIAALPTELKAVLE
jgi:uncharacterized protein (DUF2267 family)